MGTQREYSSNLTGVRLDVTHVIETAGTTKVKNGFLLPVAGIRKCTVYPTLWGAVGQ
jgi:hypothetical protein